MEGKPHSMALAAEEAARSMNRIGWMILTMGIVLVLAALAIRVWRMCWWRLRKDGNCSYLARMY